MWGDNTVETDYNRDNNEWIIELESYNFRARKTVFGNNVNLLCSIAVSSGIYCTTLPLGADDDRTTK